MHIFHTKNLNKKLLPHYKAFGKEERHGNETRQMIHPDNIFFFVVFLANDCSTLINDDNNEELNHVERNGFQSHSNTYTLHACNLTFLEKSMTLL